MALITSGATYSLFNALSRTTLDLTAGNSTSGTPMIGYDAHIYDGIYVGKNQQWKAVATTDKATDGSAYYTLNNVMGTTNLALDSATAGLQAVGRAPNATSDNQKWQLIQVPASGTQMNAYKVCSKVGGLCLEIENGNRTNGAPVIATTNANHQAQVWVLMLLQ